MSSMLDQLRTLSVAELADAMGIPESRIREMIAEGKAPPYFKVGRLFRFPLVAALKWQEEQTINPKVKP